MSQFYDRSCNNEIVRMQSQFRADLPNGPAEKASYIEKQLQQMTGVEYALVGKQHGDRLFVIHKRRRALRESTSLLASYYVLDGTVYQCPHVLTVIKRRIVAAEYYTKQALDYAACHLEMDWQSAGTYHLRQNSHEQQVCEEEDPSFMRIALQMADFNPS